MRHPKHGIGQAVLHDKAHSQKAIMGPGDVSRL